MSRRQRNALEILKWAAGFAVVLLARLGLFVAGIG